MIYYNKPGEVDPTDRLVAEVISLCDRDGSMDELKREVSGLEPIISTRSYS